MTDEEKNEAREGFGNMIRQLDDLLDVQMSDETVLDQEKLAAKRLFSELRDQLKLTLLSVDFMVPEMKESMRAGWTRMRDMALGLEDMETFVKLSGDMLAVIEADDHRHPLEIKDEVETPELRKWLTHSRTAVSHVQNVLWSLGKMEGMQRADEYRHYVERQTMEMTANRDHMLDVEAAIVRGLEKRGERVPRWRNRPKLEK
jgi:hypothetical protein